MASDLSKTPMGGLQRDLGLIDAVGVGLGAVIGAGIFVVTGVAAGVAGPAFLIGLVIAGIAATCNALSSAELAATYPESGGTYEYGYRVLHPLLGFAAGWTFLASKLAAGGIVAIGFGSYFARLFPVVSPRAGAVTAALILTIVNLFGIQKAGRLNTMIVGVTLFSLFYFVIAGIPKFDLDQYKPFAPGGVQGIAESAALLFFAYTGYARLATLGEEVHDPQRTIPKAIMITVTISVFLYLAVSIVAVGSIGSQEMATSTAPLERAAQSFRVPYVQKVITIGATAAMLGVLLSQILGISRMMFAMARRKDIPSFLAHVRKTSAVPGHGIILSGIIIIILSITGTLQSVVAAASFTILLYYSITNFAALRLAGQNKLYPKWIATLGLLSCLTLAVSLKVQTIIIGTSLLLSGFLFRPLFHKFNKE